MPKLAALSGAIFGSQTSLPVVFPALGDRVADEEHIETTFLGLGVEAGVAVLAALFRAGHRDNSGWRGHGRGPEAGLRARRESRE